MKNKPLILGLYGLSKNKTEINGYGVVSNTEAIEILVKAWDIGIRYLDTAPSYGNGNSDNLIKKVRSLGCNFKVISKIGLDINENKFVEDYKLIKKQINAVLNNHQGFLHAILLHNPTTDFLSTGENVDIFFEDVKKIAGYHINTGLSLRSPEDIIHIENFEKDTLIEVNLSWFDLRILKYLKNTKYKLIARSIYASGLINLILNKKNHGKENFSNYDIRNNWDIDKLFKTNYQDISRIEKIEKISKNKKFSEIVFSLFPILSNYIEGIIIGPLNLSELIDSYATYQEIFLNHPQQELIEIVQEYKEDLVLF